jgi:hypothetical protein
MDSSFLLANSSGHLIVSPMARSRPERDWLRRYSTLLFVVMTAGLFTSGGCSDGRLPTYPVSGRVLFLDGSPVHVGTIELKSREHGVQARGEIDTDGRFVLSTYESGDGAVVGTHDCVVVQLVMVEDIKNFRSSTEGVVHPRFGSYSSSGLVCQVGKSQRNEIDVRVEPLESAERPRESATHKHEHQPDGL